MIALPGPAYNLRPLIYPPSYIHICILVLSAPPPVYRELRLELWEHTQYDKALMILNNFATTVQKMTEYTIPVGGVNLRNLWASFHSNCRVLAYVHNITLLCSFYAEPFLQRVWDGGAASHRSPTCNGPRGAFWAGHMQAALHRHLATPFEMQTPRPPSPWPQPRDHVSD